MFNKCINTEWLLTFKKENENVKLNYIKSKLKNGKQNIKEYYTSPKESEVVEVWEVVVSKKN